MIENMKIWDALKRPPTSALKKISGGRLSGMTDIKPQWRYQAMTEIFGPVGLGWKYGDVKFWTERCSEDQVVCLCSLSLFYKLPTGDMWSDPIPGIGGSMLVTKEKSGLHTSDEGFKMAQTDALSVAMKILGVGADIYLGRFDGSKYLTGEDAKPKSDEPPPLTSAEVDNSVRIIRSCNSLAELQAVWRETPHDVRVFLAVETAKNEMKEELS